MPGMSFADRMKMYEHREAGRRCMPLLPICVRIDGKAFSRFTRDLQRPFDPRLSELMIQTMAFLVEQTGACIGYTQSDEISLILYTGRQDSQVFLDGRIQKLTSVLASMTTAFFNGKLAGAISEKAGQMAMFDCRVWSVPSREEAVNNLLWRESDASRNSVSMAARAHFSHEVLQRRSGSEMQELLHSVGVNWNDYPVFFKRGTYARRQTSLRKFTAEERKRLPPQHAAHTNPDLKVVRTRVQRLDMPPLRTVVNRVAVVFEGAEPQTAADAAS